MSAPTQTMASGSDPDQLSEILSAPRSPIKVVALNKSPVAFRCNFLATEAVSVADCVYEGRLLFKREAPSDKMMIFFPTRGKVVFKHPQTSIESVPGHCTILEGQSSTDTLLFGTRRHMVLFIDRAKIMGHLSHMLGRTVSGNIGIYPHLDLASNPGLALLRLVEQFYSGLCEDGPLSKSPLALASLCDTMTYLILENCLHRYTNALAQPAPGPAPRHVKWAIDFMQEHLAEPISLNDIAVAAKVSARTLQQGFRQFRNTSPIAHLREMRMVAAHQDLLHSGPKRTVADVAAKWGFMHPGRFAAEYQKRFGRLPSRTLE
ncbi:AraC family transcriptional regulator [Rhizobium sp. CCGE 510]|uniref:AraC family transcriptional regulator n=1 Tax=Rhizobium sp. CCGE 510 TaxID=1132836 RepID=UPI00027B8DB9|nr:AraC family transcriptional regulator [Rhizobium sp. CCGE 510]EJT06523.1 AraC family transcriptional regulator [Rhizobium sp. CCGE 510]